jgi:Flp pilus assembly protein CpaB
MPPLHERERAERVGRDAGIAPRAARRALTSRVSTGHVVMILAGLLGVILTLTLLRASDEGQAVLVAASELTPGAVIDDDSVRVERVDAQAGVLGSLFTPDDLQRLQGDVATSSIAEGALLTRDTIRSASAGAAKRSMSFPLPRARAMSGALVRGDRVDVIAVRRDTSEAGYVMTDVEVVDLDGARGGPLGGGPDEVTVTLAVELDTATRLASALESGTVTLVRSTGAAPYDAADRSADDADGVSTPAAGSGAGNG